MTTASRRAFLAGSAALLITPVAVSGQQASKMAMLGILGSGPMPSREAIATSPFVRALRQLGWEDGRNLVVERRFTESSARLPELAAELVRLRPDVIAVGSAHAVGIVRKETTSIPIVAIAAGDLVAPGLVASLARPGGNVTGIQINQIELAGKRLQLLKETLGHLTRVAVLAPWLAGPGIPEYRAHLAKEFDTAAKAVGIDWTWAYVEGADELEAAIKGTREQRVQALYVVGTPFMQTHRQRLADLALKYRLPTMNDGKEYVSAGGMMSYGVDLAEILARAATYVDKILRGRKPADLPVEQPTKFEFVINLKTAKSLGLTIPQTLLMRADEVIHQ
jgi:putative ABC transport system substrate-binding protein